MGDRGGGKYHYPLYIAIDNTVVDSVAGEIAVAVAIAVAIAIAMAITDDVVAADSVVR